MRYDKGRKDETRKLLLSKASTRFRRDGLAAVGIRPLLADVGLTHGAFYAHFPSRAHLIAEVVTEALTDTRASLERSIGRAPPGGRLDALVDTYLSTRHLENRERGCAGAALAPEVVREEQEARRRFALGVDEIAGLVAAHLPVGGLPEARMNRARVIFAGMMGVLQIARAMNDAPAADQVLAEGREAARTAAVRPWPG